MAPLHLFLKSMILLVLVSVLVPVLVFAPINAVAEFLLTLVMMILFLNISTKNTPKRIVVAMMTNHAGG